MKDSSFREYFSWLMWLIPTTKHEHTFQISKIKDIFQSLKELNLRNWDELIVKKIKSEEKLKAVV